MTELIAIINEIVKYGLHQDIVINDKEKMLEKNLIKIYSLYFDIQYDFDEIDYPDFDKTKFPKVQQNIKSNFREFGYYKTVIDINDINNLSNCGIGDAIDDLTDITFDLLEIKWRIENNSLNDGLWYFKHIFYNHTQQHIIELLNYMKQRNQ